MYPCLLLSLLYYTRTQDHLESDIVFLSFCRSEQDDNERSIHPVNTIFLMKFLIHWILCKIPHKESNDKLYFLTFEFITLNISGCYNPKI